MEVRVRARRRRTTLPLVARAVLLRTVGMLCGRTEPEEAELPDLHARVELDRQGGDIGQLERHAAGEAGVDEARRSVGEQAEPAQRRLALDAGGDVVGQSDPLVRRPEDELTGVQDEGLVALGLDLPGQVGLIRGGIDVRVHMVLEDPEVAIQAHVDARRLEHRLVPRVHHDPLGVDLMEDVAVTEEHGRNLPVVNQPATTYHRYVALGDSFTEGVGDVDLNRPNGVRGWADRVAEALSAHAADFGYANLAIRGRKVDQVIAEQIEPAVAMTPDLITIYAGANDILRPKVDIDGIATRYDAAIARLAMTGATVGIFTAFDPGSEGLFSSLRGRFALYNEYVREIAQRHGAVVLDSWRMRPEHPAAMWSPDRLHLGPLGHEYVAIRVL